MDTKSKKRFWKAKVKSMMRA